MIKIIKINIFQGYGFKKIPVNRIFLVKLQRRHRDMVKNGQKLKKGSFFLIKTLTVEMSPIGMIQETRKNTEISDVVAAIVKKRHFV